MVKYLILDEQKNDYQHNILRLGIFNTANEAFIQELRYNFDSKKLNQTTITLSLEAAKKMMEAL
ncbi:hypothetical protein LCGC14_1079600 [marine sediment metagenome]|uniref:Uncharacterized protein n=1 Tax=marine sediment metagenome TaxID=412755 RepID=A0A0F9QLG8_9ZZZZ|nr:MAG: hypothetical protein Lokiarch_05830 [Candidatus Lokiarchaeum sp. GC14_75]